MMRRMDLDALQAELAGTPLQDWSADLPGQIDAKLAIGHGDLQRWYAAVEALPPLQAEQIDLQQDFRLDGPCDDATRAALDSALRGLIPWRKGPFHPFGVHVDTEWRSDWKWQRVAPHLDLTGKRILDVGCGNGYYMWRMLGAGARSAVGIDPNWLFLCQFLAMKNYLPDMPAWHLPLGIEELPPKLLGFDTVFSMGVLYHRRSPIDHLLELKDCLRKGGELVLETLVVEGDAQQVLVPEDRYAQMRNVWFLPSVPALELWLRRAGFVDVRCVDVSVTSVEEQRSTDWMRYQSLPEFLDPLDHRRTIEGLPAPRRAVLVARKP
ncbi:tRNA 5-methoxyuridine(34)/uridine 5-oxyacetic acid(34) synthase CmoB [Pseudomonas argentinensis]|uniref:tRNA U34 carboxymethyltransferase n=1 Tax=Phytopseudomonas argentinensis TaxID=289370 RepID=A0A1I3H9A8_9GAMM|nr:tRNA 5-methoxyuridine(34)/uridine 5-oxyacetic acid(34) synthase CmoB [Pseudomonas argentinensis]KAB0548576.1 tRNA 5-methoxyuridine(34)/uridine 5-oxyacetic acid(34) synthase CmoB [Pseudomonas argentinensis]SFI32209.1 tRNA (mo5U34)-methyltransferase [Pseudomonas argentinensis]